MSEEGKKSKESKKNQIHSMPQDELQHNLEKF